MDGPMVDAAALRAEFERMLTVDGSRDRRRRDYNVAIFDPEGWAIWNRTELGDVMAAFDHALASLRRPPR